MPPEFFGQLIQTGNWLVVAGFFDPLTAVQANRLASLRKDGRKLAAIVLSDPNTLFDDDARATLIASLRDVHAVTVAKPESWRSLLPDNPGLPEGADVQVIDDLAGEKARSADFVRLILTRSDAE